MYKFKKYASEAVIRHKARLVAKGYVQRVDIDFEEAFAPVARLDSVRALLAVAAHEAWAMHQVDIKLAFLKGELEEKVQKRVLMEVYVDDLIVTGADQGEVEAFKEEMKRLFKMSDLGCLSYYLGIKVK
ncbi:hypothetical protein AXG93_2912s1520 [Marchantia polymorpha subsp. ruderalis]|uniref:Reverse transcriptase Ty1/copia-type domain-containing protein n=1 Tax=Marchantia polymorpha subsp. ruderalis TaxID=1480154 RepID=A0A176WII3_MARPO|nr:hypothetical protein AXG93_2912s1520 [Marchantia polymorpha subsp. ruderalis]